MQLDKEGRVERGRKGGLASAEERRKKIIPRDDGLILAYKHLIGDATLSKEDTICAIIFLKSIGLGPNPPKKVSVLVHLATAVDISIDRLQRILRKAKKHS